MRTTADYSAFFKFAMLSGFGWLLDLSVLLLLVRVAGFPPFAGNLCSSALAAGTVFLISRRRIHHGVDGAAQLRLALYLAYTFCLILITSLAIPILMEDIVTWMNPHNRTVLVLIAKVIVTPPQLVLNFVVSRALARFQWKRVDAPC